MKFERRQLRSKIAVVSAICVVLLMSQAQAQSGSMSAQELQNRLDEQRAALEEVISNRSATQFMTEQLQTELDKAKSRKEKVEQELKELCKRQSELTNGSVQECITQAGG